MSCWRGDDLGHRRLEAVEDHRGDVELAGLEHLHDALGDLLGVAEAEPRAAEIGDGLDDVLGEVAAQLVAALAADASILTVLPSASSERMARRASRTIELLKPPHRPRSAVATISRWTWSEPVPASSRGPVPPLKLAPSDGHEVVHGLGIGAGRHGLLLGAPQLGRGHHLHGLGDLLRRLDASDPEPEGFETGHRSRRPLRRTSW